MEEKTLNQLLNEIFSSVNNWLNFAEAKNAANMALVVACLTAIFNYEKINCFLYLISLFFILSGIFSMISFFPKLAGKSVIGRILDYIARWLRKETVEENLIFFGDIKKYSKEDSVKKINEIYYHDKDKQVSEYQLDLSSEIVYNSNITSFKYALFKIAILLDIIAFLILGIGVIKNIF